MSDSSDRSFPRRRHSRYTSYSFYKSHPLHSWCIFPYNPYRSLRSPRSRYRSNTHLHTARRHCSFHTIRHPLHSPCRIRSVHRYHRYSLNTAQSSPGTHQHKVHSRHRRCRLLHRHRRCRSCCTIHHLPLHSLHIFHRTHCKMSLLRSWYRFLRNPHRQ